MLGQRWLDGFNNLEDTFDRASWLALKAAYTLSVAQIQTMYGPTESIYDHSMEAYIQGITAIEANLAA